MATLRSSSNNPNTSDTVWIVADNLNRRGDQHYAINLYDSAGNHKAYMTTHGGGTSAGYYYTSAHSVSGLSAGTQYGFYVNLKETSASITERVPSSGYYYTSTASAPTGDGNDTFSTATYMYEGSNSSSIYSSSDVDYFRFVPSASSDYTFTSSASFDIKGELYNSSQVLLDSQDDNAGSMQFQIKYYLYSGSTYYLKVQSFGSTGNYTINVVKTQAPDDVGNTRADATQVYVGSTYSRNLDNGNDLDYFKFVAPASKTYNFETVSSMDTYGTLENSSGTILTTDDDSGEYSNFLISYQLTAGQTYYIQVRGYGSAGSYATGSYTFKVTEATTLPSAPTVAPSVNTSSGDNGRFEGGLYLYITAVANATEYVVRARNGSTLIASTTVYSTASAGTQLSVAFSGLNYGYAHTIEYLARNSNGDSAMSPFIVVNTLPQTPQIKGSSITGGVQIRLDPLLSGGWTDVTVEVWNSAKTSQISTHTITYGSSTSVNITGLTNNTTYNFKARSRYYVNSTNLYSYSYSAWETVITGQKPVAWGWTTGTDGNGNKVAGSTFTMNASEWNTFQDRINEWRAYKGVGAWNFYSADTYSGTGAFTRASSGGIFYHWHMNQAITAINTMIATGVSTKSAGNNITASDLNTLKNKLNSIT